MTETVASWLLAAAGLYLAVGLPVAAAFVLRGAARVDPRAEGGSWGFRLAILPGCVALWPLVARRWRHGPPPPEERNAHRQGARPGGSVP